MDKKIKAVLLTITLLIYVSFTVKVINIFLADYYHIKGKKLLYRGYLSEANDNINKAIKLNYEEPSYHRTNAALFLAALSLKEGDMQKIKQYALSEMETAYNLQKINLVNLKHLLSLYYYLSFDDAVDPREIDDRLKTKTMTFFEEVKDISPNDSSVYLTIGKYYGLLKEYELAEEALEKALKLKPDLKEAKDELDAVRVKTGFKA